jgi:hypothetical protein
MLGFAGEYALLALIEDAPAALKVATVLCAIGALVALESETFLNQKGKQLFVKTIAALSAIYLCCVAYAISQAMYQAKTRSGLEDRYVAAAALATRSIPPNSAKNHMDGAAIASFASDVNDWETECANWILERLNAAARERFMDQSGGVSFTYTNQYGSDPAYDRVMNHLPQIGKT